MPNPEDRIGISAPENASPAGPPPPSPAPRRAPRAARRQSRFLAFVRGTAAVITIIVFVGAATGAVVGYTIYEQYAADLPSLDGLRTYQPPVVSRIYAGDDHLIAELAQERRIFVPFSAIPELVTKAFIAAEDKSFYEHKGVDPMAIARAAVTDLQRIGENRRPVGASTITQQVARNMLLGSQDVSFKRKVKEALLALRLERVLTKQRILELYLNMIYLGQGSYGVAAAAQAYFNAPLDKLTIAQAASLAALPKSPTNYNPFHEPDAALDRRNWVIDRMVETGAITAAQGQAAHAEPLGTSAYQRPQTVTGSEWFATEVKRQLIERFGQDQASQGGLVVHTSLDPVLQREADATLRNGLMDYDRHHGGWRGAAGHLGAEIGLHMDWAARLAEAKRPPGMLPDWKLGVVLEETGGSAKLGWLDGSADPNSPQPRISTIRLSRCRLGPHRQARWRKHRRDPQHGRRCGAGRPADDERGAGGRPRRRPHQPAPDPRRGGGDRFARSRHRTRARALRRLERGGQPVRPRHPGAAAAGQLVQAVRVSDRDGKGHLAQRPVHGCAVRARRLAPGELRTEHRRPHTPARGAGAVPEPRDRAAGPAYRHGFDRQDRDLLPSLRCDAAGAAGLARRGRDNGAAGSRRLRGDRRGRPPDPAQPGGQRAGPVPAMSYGGRRAWRWGPATRLSRRR